VYFNCVAERAQLQLRALQARPQLLRIHGELALPDRERGIPVIHSRRHALARIEAHNGTADAEDALHLLGNGIHGNKTVPFGDTELDHGYFFDTERHGDHRASDDAPGVLGRHDDPTLCAAGPIPADP